MRLAVIMPARTVHVAGVQRFADALLEGFEELCDEVETARFHPEAGRTRLRAASAGLMKVLGMHAERPFDAVFSTFHWPWKLIPTVPMGGFIHDLRQHDLGRLNPKNLTQRAIVTSWDITCVASPHVAREVQMLAPSVPVKVVGEGLDHLQRYWRPEHAALARDHIVVIAGRAPHKRAGLGLEAAEAVVEEHGCPAVVLGRTPRPPNHPAIDVWTRYTDEDLVSLFCRSRVVIAPTAYEGFGLAAGEAMWFGVPVVYGQDAHLDTLVGAGGAGVAPDAEAMAAAAREIWRHGSPCSPRKVAASYTWVATAQAILDALATSHRRSRG